MECFNQTIDTIVKALNSSLHKRGYRGEFLINVQRTKEKFNIWTFRFELVWIKRPAVCKTIYTFLLSSTLPSGQEEKVKEQLLIEFLCQLFDKQEDIWNLISTSQD